MTDLNAFRTFVAAAEAKSFSGAAAALGLTRSAVGKAVARLELQTGARLFHRTTRVMTLTPEGEALYARATETIKELQAAVDELAGRGQQPSGLLRMTLPDAYGRIRVLPVLTKFLCDWPKLRADVTFTDRTADIIAEGFDVAIRIGPSHADSDLVARVIARHRASFLASPHYLERYGLPTSLEELKTLNCIQYVQRGRRLPWQATKADGKVASLEVGGRVSFDNGQAIRDAAIQGLGVVHLEDYLVDSDVAAGRLVRILEANEPPLVPVAVLYPTKRLLAPKVRLWIDALTGADL